MIIMVTLSVTVRRTGTDGMAGSAAGKSVTERRRQPLADSDSVSLSPSGRVHLVPVSQCIRDLAAFPTNSESKSLQTRMHTQAVTDRRRARPCHTLHFCTSTVLS